MSWDKRLKGWGLCHCLVCYCEGPYVGLFGSKAMAVRVVAESGKTVVIFKSMENGLLTVGSFFLPVFFLWSRPPILKNANAASVSFLMLVWSCMGCRCLHLSLTRSSAVHRLPMTRSMQEVDDGELGGFSFR